jgi:hypothetical protein
MAFARGKRLLAGEDRQAATLAVFASPGTHHRRIYPYKCAIQSHYEPLNWERVFP